MPSLRRTVAGTVLMALCAAAHPGMATTPSREGRRALVRSAIIPGWGQLSAGSTVKGLVFVAVSASLAYGHLRVSHPSSHQRRELNRWSALFWLFNLGDAYVDGYLRFFDEEMRDIDAIGEGLMGSEPNSRTIRLGFSLRW